MFDTQNTPDRIQAFIDFKPRASPIVINVTMQSVTQSDADKCTTNRDREYGAQQNGYDIRNTIIAPSLSTIRRPLAVRLSGARNKLACTSVVT